MGFTFQYRVNDWQYSILVVLEAAELQRMKQRDPVIVGLDSIGLVMRSHNLKLKEIVIAYVAPKDVPRLRELAANGKPQELLRFANPAWKPEQDGIPSGKWSSAKQEAAP